MVKKSIIALTAGLFSATAAIAQPQIVGPLDARNNLNEIAGNGSTAQTTARTNLGLGSIATQGANSVAITGGSITGADVSGATATPTGALIPAATAALAAQQGVLLDTFKSTADADDTMSMVRAVAAGMPILLGPRTYTINNYSMVGTPAAFVLKGVQGKSVIQRTSASGSQFFNISANLVVIDGVTFDMNRASVTANQWGVFIGTCGQTVLIRHSVFKNNSGTLGGGLAHVCTTGTVSNGSFNISDSEISGNAWNALYLASVANGIVSRNHVHDNNGTGIFTSAYTGATTTNYSADIAIDDNRIFRNSGTGIAAGGYAPPYTFAVSPAFRITASNNTLIDNAQYAISLECDFCRAIHNNIAQSSPSVTIFGGIDTLMRYGMIDNNTVTLLNTPWGIDVGGSIQMTVQNNIVTMNQGTGINIGGNQNSVFLGNHVMMSGTGAAMSATSVESDGSGNVFPTLASNITLENNNIDLSGSAATGVRLSDNAGGFAGTSAVIVRNNHFTTTGSGTGSFQVIQWNGRPGSLFIDRNDLNGSMSVFTDPNVNNYLLVDTVQIGGWTVYGSNSSNTSNIVMLSTNQIGSYGGGSSIFYAYPTSVGSGYSAATILTASGTGGGSGWTGTAMIYGGQIIGVRTLTSGTGYSGTVAITATDSGGGSGAVIFVGNVPTLPNYATLTYLANGTTHLLLLSGAYTRINYSHPLMLDTTSAVQLQVINGGSFWSVNGYTVPTFAIGALPPSNTTTCTSPYNGVQINVTGSVSGAWQARCNGTNWIAPSGSTIN